MVLHGSWGIAAGLVLWCWTSLAAAAPEDEFATAAEAYRNQAWDVAFQRFANFRVRYPQDPRSPDALFYQAEAAAQRREMAEAQRLFAEFRSAVPQHPQSPRASFRIGELAYLTQDDATAQAELAAFVRANPRHELAGYALPYLGDMAWQAGQYVEARRYYEETIRSFPAGPLVPKCLCYLGMLDFRDQRWDDALPRFEEFESTVPVTHPLYRQAMYWCGRTELELGQAERAADRLTRLAQQEPATPRSRAGDRGDGRRGDNDLEPSILYFAARANRLLQRYPVAKNLYQQLIKVWPQSPRVEDAAYDSLLMLTNDSPEQLRDQADRFIASYGQSQHVPDVQRLVAQEFLNQHQFREAQTYLTELFRSTASVQTDDRYLMALAQLGQDDFTGTLHTLEEGRPAWDEEQYPNVLRASAAALIGLEQYDEAARRLQTFLDRYGDSSDANDVRRDLQDALARSGPAEPPFAGIDQVVPSESPALPSNSNLSTRLAMAKTAYTQSRYDQAAKLFQVIATSSGLPDDLLQQSLAGWGASSLQIMDWQSARDAYERLLKSNPASGFALEAYRGLGKAYTELKDAGKAAQQYQQLLKVADKDDDAALAHLQLARWHESRKQQFDQDPARRLDSQKEYEQAVGHLRTLERDYRNTEQYAAALYLWAWLEKGEGHVEAAVEKFGELTKQKDSEYWDDAMYRIADVAVSNKKYADAEALLNQLLDAGRDAEIRPYAILLQAQTLAGLGNRWEEIPALLSPLVQAGEGHPLYAAARYWTAESYYRSDRIPEAAQEFQDLARSIKDQTASWVPMVALRVAQIKAIPSEQKTADDYQAALDLADSIGVEWPEFPQQFEVDYVRGRCLVKLARLPDAREAFLRAIKQPQAQGTETQAMSHWNLGETYYQQQDFAEALRTYVEVVRTYNRYPLWQAHAALSAGLASERLGRRQDAMGYYQRLLRDFSVNETLNDRAQRQLQALTSGASTRRSTNIGLQ